MAQKIGKGYATSKLTKAMAGDQALVTPGVNWDAPTVLPATPASVGPYEQPMLDESITALLIMSGCSAMWAINFWVVTDKKGNRVHLAKHQTFDEWHAALKYLAEKA
jgi:hypothetical protein